MRNIIVFIIGFICLILIVCPAFSTSGTTEVNIFDGIDRYYGKRVIQTCIELTSNDGSTTFLKPGVRFEEERFLYFFVFYLYAYDWFSIEQVIFIIDNERYVYESADEARNVIVNGVIKELV